MTKTFILQSNILQRMFVLMLAVVLVFSSVSAPVSANTASTFIEIGTSYGDVASVAPYLIPFILIIAGLDWYYSNIDEIVAKAEELYNNASTAVWAWAEDVGSKLKQGTSTRVRIPSEVLDEVGTAVGVLVSGVVSYLVIPKTLSRIDTLTRTDVFADSYLEALTKSNTLVGSISTSISTLINTVIVIPNLINTKIVATTQAVKDWGHTLNANLGNWLDSIGVTLHGINTNVRDWLERVGATTHGINDKFAHFRNDFSSYVSSIGEKIASLPTTIVEAITSLPTKVATAFTNIQTSIEAKIQSAAEAIASAVAGSIVVQGAQNIISTIDLGLAEIAGVVAGAVSSIMVFVGALQGFTNVLGRLFDIPLVSALLYVSLAVGVISLVLNLAKNGSRDNRRGCNCNCGRW